MSKEICIFWFRRDLRLEDNTALQAALKSGYMVIPIFIFDDNIIDELPRNDSRVSFIYDSLKTIHALLVKKGSSLLILKGKPAVVWDQLVSEFNIKQVYFNKDYEPYALQRDQHINHFLKDKGIKVCSYKDQVIFEENEILKPNGEPYTVFTPYKRKWLFQFDKEKLQINNNIEYISFFQSKFAFPDMNSLGFEKSDIKVKNYKLSHLEDYHLNRDYPNLDATSNLSAHLRFGTVSIRKIIKELNYFDDTFLGELIWREFFMQILFHFPNVVTDNFKSKYNKIEWRNNEREFKAWCNGQTGYPLVDAGMKQLNKTAYMHNRVRMVVGSFLCKHLLIDWRWGEAYFAKKLMDYELSSNNGNWQWVAGTGCDAAPYFRIFNPEEQLKKFDHNLEYVKKWIPEFRAGKYLSSIVEHKFARERALKAYKKALD